MILTDFQPVVFLRYRETGTAGKRDRDLNLWENDDEEVETRRRRRRMGRR